jgi:GWxTD domain-containing protein
MFKRTSYLSLIILAAVITGTMILNSCVMTEPVARARNVASIYNPTKNPIIPDFTVYNNSDEESVLSIKLRRDQLLFTEANAAGVPMAAVNIRVFLYNKNLNGLLCDSAAYDFDIKRENAMPDFVCRVALKVFRGASYYAVIKITDKIKQTHSTSYLDISKNDEFEGNNFKVYDHFNKKEIFTRVLRPDEYINIRYPQKSVDTLFLFYYKPVTNISPAPSVLLPETTVSDKPAKMFIMPSSDTLPMMFPKQGIYLFSIDSTRHEGVTICNFGDDYPGMTKASTMIPPLEYIATTEEMDSLRLAENQKVALDNFWLKHAGNIEKAKELIRIYYFRVQYANMYFASYKAGWLTDRGMIYMLYGPPDMLQKSIDVEKWGYKLPAVKSKWGSRYSVESQYVWFVFTRKDNIFTQNDYSLNRSQTPISYWDEAVASWRRGKVFRLDNPKEYQ